MVKKLLSKKIALVLLLITTMSATHIKASDYYWVGGTGNWSDYANHWATTSGGVIFHTTIPSPFDDVYFDANSFLQTGDSVLIDSTIINCRTMDWSGAINNPVFKGTSPYIDNLRVYGSFILNQNIKWNFDGYLNLSSSTISNSINTNGLILHDSIFRTFIFIDGTGSFNLLNDITATQIEFDNGTFNSNNYNINTQFVSYTGNTTYPINVLLGTSTINGYVYLSNNFNLNIDADSATFNCYIMQSYRSMHFNNVTCSGYIKSDSCYFKNVQTQAITGSNNTFNSIEFLNSNCGYFNYTPCNFIDGTNNTFHSAIVHCNLDIDGTQLFDTLNLDTPGQIISLHGNSININNQLQVNGNCDGLIYFISKDNLATIIFNGGVQNFDYLYLQNINSIGSLSCTANNSIDAGGNLGWTINSPSPRTLYWVGGSGNWNDASHWSTSSGSIGGVCIPNQNDSLFFDSNSFLTSGDTVFANTPLIFCNYMDWSGAINAPVFQSDKNFQSQLSVFGSFILNQNISMNNFESIHLISNSSSNIIKTFGNDVPTTIYLEGAGQWDLQSDLKSSVFFKGGTFHSNNFNINGSLGTFTGVSNNVSVFLGTSSITGTNFDFYYGTNISLDADSAFINCGYLHPPDGLHFNDAIASDINANSCTFHDVVCHTILGNNNSFRQVLFDSTGICRIEGNNNTIRYAVVPNTLFSFGGINTAVCTFDSLIFIPAGQSIYFNNGSYLTIKKYINVNGSCTGFMSLICNSGNATIQKNGGAFTSNYLMLQNINSTGAAFTANNSIDGGGNSGIIINSPLPRNLYWVGGSGNMLDINHWSTISGGAGGACVPNQFDDLFFDANSFSTVGDTVFLNQSVLNFHSMDWTGVINAPTLMNSAGFFIYGSFVLSTNMNTSLFGALSFMSNDTGNIINTNGISLNLPNYFTFIYFYGSGSWDLLSDLDAGNLRFLNGTFRTNNHNINAGNINGYGIPVNPVIYFGKSIINAGAVYFDSNYTVDFDSSQFYTYDFNSSMSGKHYNFIKATTIIGTQSSIIDHAECGSVNGNNNFFPDLKFIDYDNCAISGTNNIFKNIIMPSNICSIVYGNNTFDTLVFNKPGQTIQLNDTTTVNNYILIQSSPGFPTTIKGVNGDGYISMPAGDTVCTDYLYMQDIHSTGGAAFYAGDNSVDLGNNTGWNFTSCTPDTSNVWPGDCNYDLIVGNNDLLYIGVGYGYSGPVRANASLNYVAQPCVDWLQQFAIGTNIKHADCDGNGLIDFNDTIAISLNYGLSHPAKPINNPVQYNYGIPMYFDLPAGALVPGTTVSIPIDLGTALSPADNFYGMAFTVNYDPAFVVQGTMKIDFTNTWLGNNSNTLFISKDNYANGTVDGSVVRIDHTNMSGNGQFATLTFTVANGVSGITNFSFSKIFAIDKFEIPIAILPTQGSVYTSLNENPALQNMISVYPNPASTSINILDLNNIIQKIEMMDVSGRVVSSSAHTMTLNGTAAQGASNKISLDIENISNGIYFLRVETSKGVLNEKVVVRK